MARAPGRGYRRWINHQFWSRALIHTCPEPPSLTGRHNHHRHHQQSHHCIIIIDHPSHPRGPASKGLLLTLDHASSQWALFRGSQRGFNSDPSFPIKTLQRCLLIESWAASSFLDNRDKSRKVTEANPFLFHFLHVQLSSDQTKSKKWPGLEVCPLPRLPPTVPADWFLCGRRHWFEKKPLGGLSRLEGSWNEATLGRPRRYFRFFGTQSADLHSNEMSSDKLQSKSTESQS